MTAFSLLGGRVIDPARGHDAVGDLHVVNGVISTTPAADAPTHDVTGHWVLPGLVDLHARLAASGRAVAGRAHVLHTARQNGITSLCIGPDMEPTLDSVAALEQLSHFTTQARATRVHPIGALTQGLAGEQLAELATLSGAGCVAFGDLGRTTADARVLLRAMRYAGNFDLTVFVQPNDPWLAAGGCVNDGPIAHRLGLPGVPASAETVAVSLWLELCRETGTRLHFNKLSTARSVALVRAAQADGLPVTADTSLNHTFFDDSALAGFENRFKVWPPLRGANDRAALRAGLLDGTLTAVCSDHCTHGVDDILAPLQSAEAGGETFDVLLPAVASLGDTLGASPAVALRWLTAGPAAVLRTPVGSLANGAAADLCVFDPTVDWVFGDTAGAAQPHSPWRGARLRGRVVGTALAGDYRPVAR
ncbi:MAG: amidohydrolase family protein [Pseudomonadota bacterium]